MNWTARKAASATSGSIALGTSPSYVPGVAQLGKGRENAPGVLDKGIAAPTVIPMDPVLDTPTIIDFETPTARSRVITARAAVEEAQEQLLSASQQYRDEVRAYFWSRRQSNVSHRKIAEELGIADTTLRELLRFNRRSTR